MCNNLAVALYFAIINGFSPATDPTVFSRKAVHAAKL